MLVSITGALPALFGLGYGPEGDVARYLLLSFWFVTVAAGAGLSACAQYVRTFAPVGPVEAFAAFVLTLAIANKGIGWQRDDRNTEQFIGQVAAQTPDGAVIVAPWNQGTALAYGAYVELRLGTRIVDVAGSDTEAPNVARWLRTRPVYAFDLPKGFTFAGLRAEKIANFDPPLWRLRRVIGPQK